jgi:hypothetical protein
MEAKTKLLIAGAGLFFIYNEMQKRNCNPKVFYVDFIPGNHTACVVPPFGILIKKDEKGNKALLAHEKVHWQQYQREGLFPFVINYWKQHFKVGYDLNPYEIEARLKSGEVPCCIADYTNCVREGRAVTVHNPNFKL